jgi:hypothetical protein
LPFDDEVGVMAASVAMLLRSLDGEIMLYDELRYGL